jgi:hypothetical protein
MSIIVLTPPPKNPSGSAAALSSGSPEPFGNRLASELLHLVGLEGHRFDSFEALRDFAQAQIDAAGPTVPADAAPSA